MSSGEPNAKRIKFNSAVGKVCDRGTKKVWYLPLLTVCKDISSGGDMEPSRVPGDFMYEDPWKAYRAIVIESFALLYSEFAPSSFELTPVQFADEALVIIDEYEDSDMSPERSDCESDCDSGSERCTHCSRTNCDCANESDSSCQGLRQRLKKVKMNREDDESSLNTWRSIFVAIEAELYEADGGYCMNVFEIEDHYADVSASYTLVATAESGDGVHKHHHYLGPYLTDNMDQVRFAVLSAVLMQTFAFIKDEFERDIMQDHMMHLAAWNATSKNEGFDFKQAFEDLRDWIRRLHKERLADGDANVADVLEKLHTAAHADIILFEYLKQLIGFLKRIQEIDSRDIYNLSYQVTILNVKLAPTTAANTGVVPIRRDQPSECKREEILNETNGAYVYVLRNGLGKERADRLFQYLANLPIDARSRQDAYTALKHLDKKQYASYQKSSPGFHYSCLQFCVSPRQIAAFHIKDTKGLTTYRYSGQTVEAKPMSDDDPILEACHLVSQKTNTSFDFALLNRYVDGNDCIFPHQDKETDLNPGDPIVSCVVGASRPFELSKIDKSNDNQRSKVRFMLHHGDILVMVRQGEWKHGIPRELKRTPRLKPYVIPSNGTTTDMRFSVTLRKMKRSVHEKKKETL
jgi:alkylated DNA repair dioxygenase AlkB